MPGPGQIREPHVRNVFTYPARPPRGKVATASEAVINIAAACHQPRNRSRAAVFGHRKNIHEFKNVLHRTRYTLSVSIGQPFYAQKDTIIDMGTDYVLKKAR